MVLFSPSFIALSKSYLPPSKIDLRFNSCPSSHSSPISRPSYFHTSAPASSSLFLLCSFEIRCSNSSQSDPFQIRMTYRIETVNGFCPFLINTTKIHQTLEMTMRLRSRPIQLFSTSHSGALPVTCACLSTVVCFQVPEPCCFSILEVSFSSLLM